MNIPYVFKKCSKCGEWLVANSVNFNKHKNSKYGLRSYCKECKRKADKEYAYKNKDKIKERSKKYYNENKDKINERSKKYYDQNKKVKPKEEPPKNKICTSCGKLLPNTKDYFYEGGKRKDGTKRLQARCKECEKLYHRTQDKIYYQNNKEAKKQYNREYVKNHKEKIRENWKKYLQTDKGKIARANSKANSSAKRRLNEQKLKTPMKSYQYKEMMDFFDNKCAYSGRGDFITRDHIIPLKKGGEHAIWNLVPMHGPYNFSKQDKDIEEWYKQQDYFSEERLAKIREWQEYAYKKYSEK